MLPDDITDAGPIGPGPYPTAEIVTGGRYVRDYVVEVSFADGFFHEVDLAEELHGPVFGPLKDKILFSQVRFDPEVRTIAWPNGADLAPEFLRYGPDRPDCPCSMHEYERRRLAAEKSGE